HATVDEAELKIAEIYSNKLLKFAQDNNEKEELYLKSIEICKKVIETGMVESVIEKAYSKIVTENKNISNFYSSMKYPEREKFREYSENSIKYGEEYVKKYSNSNSNILYNILNDLATTNYSISISYYFDEKNLSETVEYKAFESIKWFKRKREISDYTTDEYSYLSFRKTIYDWIFTTYNFTNNELKKNQYYNEILNFGNDILSGQLNVGGFISKKDIYKSFGNVFFENSEFKSALEWYQKAYNEKPDNKVKLNIGKSYLKMGEISKAKSTVEDVISQNDYTKAIAYDLLGDINFSTGNYAEAKNNYETAIGNAVSTDLMIYPTIEGKIAKTLCKLGEYNKSLEKINELLEKYYHSRFWVSDKNLEEDKILYSDLLKIKVTPLIENLNPGESVILTAKITYPDGTEINTSDLEEMTWSWSGTGKKTTKARLEYYQHGNTKYTLKPVNNSNQIEFTLLEGDYMEPIITAKVTF
ncbi:MAG: hypothetical protein WC337_11645, partial [Candidatus Muiribacteriota bacterium]